MNERDELRERLIRILSNWGYAIENDIEGTLPSFDIADRILALRETPAPRVETQGGTAQVGEGAERVGEPDAGEALRYAEQLAIVIWEIHFRDDAPDWKPMSGDLMGILSQIDNMTSGMVRPDDDESTEPAETSAPPTINRAEIDSKLIVDSAPAPEPEIAQSLDHVLLRNAADLADFYRKPIHLPTTAARDLASRLEAQAARVAELEALLVDLRAQNRILVSRSADQGSRPAERGLPE